MGFRLSAAVCLLALAATLPLSGETIQGCVDTNKGTLRIVRPGEPCDAKEYALSWNGGAGCEAGAPQQIGTVSFAGISGGPFPIYQLSGGAKNPVDLSGGGGTATGKVEFSGISIVRKVDVASPTLLKWVATGAHVPNITIDLSATSYVKLSDVLLSGLEFTSLPGSAELFETVGIAFGRIEIRVDNKVTCWDLKEFKTCN